MAVLGCNMHSVNKTVDSLISHHGDYFQNFWLLKLDSVFGFTLQIDHLLNWSSSMYSKCSVIIRQVCQKLDFSMCQVVRWGCSKRETLQKSLEGGVFFFLIPLKKSNISCIC